MASVNKVFLIGNVGRDPEVRYSNSGLAVCNVSLATTSRRKDKNSGDTIEDTQWHRVTFYDRLAEIVGEYVKKGSPIHVEGSIKYGKYTDKDGIERTSCDIVASSMQLLGGRDGGGEQRQSRGRDDRDEAPRRPAPQGRGREPEQRQGQGRSQGRGAPATGFDDMDDDIPFATNSMACDMTTGKPARLARTRF